ncbi:MAG: hypothetical protein HYS41_04875 [Candidatus Omnitrophica bacterium]|nr:hypothetical protein [Candidatus Omnitrophota bacterium]
MKRESLLNLKTCREIVTGMDIARGKRSAPTMFQKMRRIVSQGTGEFTPHVNEATLAVEMDKERRRFGRRYQKVERAAAKILGFRRKLAATHEKNRRIMDLRIDLQRQYWENTRPAGLKAPCLAGAVTEAEGRRIKVRRLRYGGRS